jgi:hypothetical protein
MTTVLKKGTIKRIHINKHVIAKNLKEGTDAPAVTVQTSKKPYRGKAVAIHGPSAVVTSMDKPLKCGARIWIETKSEVTVL